MPTLNIGNIKIEYLLSYKDVKNINIRIRSGKLYVSANRNISIQKINQCLETKSDWILKNIEKFSNKREEKVQKQENDIEMKNGKLIKVFGQNHILKIIICENRNISLKEDGILEWRMKISDYSKKDKIFLNSFKEFSKKTFEEILKRMYKDIEKFNVPYPKVKVREMKTRWGVCNITKKEITLNMNLMRYDTEIIEFVIMHEMIHFIVPNHSKEFYRYFDLIMPSNRERNKKLKIESLKFEDTW